jgi:hypothetical protein
MTTDNPLVQLEDQKMWSDMGKQGYFIMKGALDEGATMAEAIQIVMAFYAGMIQGSKDNDAEAE